MRRNQWAAVLLALLLFASGVAVGALAHRYYTATAVNAKTEGSRQHYISEMQSKLKLTPAQVTQLESIADETKAKYHAVRDSYRPEMLKIKQDHINRVKAILTPEQIPLYEQLVAERERRSRDQEDRDSRPRK
jgi:Spy/CpxP family protein refolding chaperone